jgi:hypothetical protein
MIISILIINQAGGTVCPRFRETIKDIRESPSGFLNAGS